MVSTSGRSSAQIANSGVCTAPFVLRGNRIVLACALVICTGASVVTSAPFDTSNSEQYLLIARDLVEGGTDAQVNNSEVGANKAPVPASSGFKLGPSLLGTAPDIPCSVLTVFSGIGFDGNIAIADPQGIFNLQNVGHFADLGAHLAAASDAFNTSSDSFFNDPNDFPNTLDTVFLTGTECNTDGTGVLIDPAIDADQSTRIDAAGTPGNVGISYSFNHAALLTELSDIKTALLGLSGTGTLPTTAGVISTDTTFTAVSGLNVIDVSTGGADFVLSNANLIIGGPADAFVIFRLPGTINMIVTQANILIVRSAASRARRVGSRRVSSRARTARCSSSRPFSLSTASARP